MVTSKHMTIVENLNSTDWSERKCPIVEQLTDMIILSYKHSKSFYMKRLADYAAVWIEKNVPNIDFVIPFCDI